MPARTLRGTPEGWTRVAEHVRRRRIQELGLSADQVVERSGKQISVTVLSIIENARQEAYSVRVLAGLCRALEWTPESIELILDGGQPSPIESKPRPSQDDVEARLADITRRLEEALAEVEELRLGRQRNDTAGHEA